MRHTNPLRRVLGAVVRRLSGEGTPRVPVGRVRFGDLRRVRPIDRNFGYGRGLPVDRYYIEQFLATHAAEVRGRVLEIADDSYTRRFGGSRVARSDVLFPEPGHAPATIVGDLASGAGLPSGAFDCAVITQTLLLVYDVHAAVRTLHRMLKPGGVLLATLPGICQIAAEDDARWGDFWRFTPRGAARLFGEVFGPENTSVGSLGNVLAATCFLYGIAAEELRPPELSRHDPDYPVTITVRAVKA